MNARVTEERHALREGFSEYLGNLACINVGGSGIQAKLAFYRGLHGAGRGGELRLAPKSDTTEHGGKAHGQIGERKAASRLGILNRIASVIEKGL